MCKQDIDQQRTSHEQTAAIQREILERREYAEQEIERLNMLLAARDAELEAVNRELDTFNHSIAHGLRQPLNVIGMYCQAIRLKCGDHLQHECLEYASEAYKATLNMDRLISALLDYLRMGRAEPRREEVDLGMMAQMVAQSLQQAEPGRQVVFQIADGVVADADAGLLQVVMENLLSNAWKYTSLCETAVIEFGVMNIEGMPAYFVRDNGIGLDKKDLDRLFIPFTRLHGPEISKGFGLGLATAERIIRQHCGTLWAESGPGKGTTFYFTLQSA